MKKDIQNKTYLSKCFLNIMKCQNHLNLDGLLQSKTNILEDFVCSQIAEDHNGSQDEANGGQPKYSNG